MRRPGAAACIALAVATACRPTTHGRCAQDADCRTGSVCAPEGICVAIAPSVSISVVTPPDAGGWYSRSGADLEIVATASGGGTDPIGAVLSFTGCATSSCIFAGALGPAGQFTFLIPRQVQAAGSEAPLPYQVVVTDRVGNEGKALGTLDIDDAAPVIQPFLTTNAGTVGEDGNVWFGGPSVEIAVPVSDAGAGVGAVSLRVDPNDVKSGTPLAPAPMPAADGSVHFLLPASETLAQGPLHFSLTATDRLGHASTVPVNSVLVDAIGPAVTLPHLNYAGAQPAAVCDPLVTCGRQAGTQILRDDVADLTFDVTDCGVGTRSGAVVVTNGQTLNAVETGSDPSTCANGNRTHHYKATVDFSVAAPLLPPANASGTVALPVSGSGADLLANMGTGAAPAGATGGDGVALISLWRWKRKLVGPATGSPVIIPGGGAARVAVGTANAVTAFSPMGAQSWTQTVTAGVGADLAISPSGRIYAVSPLVACGTCSGVLNIVTASAITACPSQANVSFGAPPAVTTANGAEAAIAIAPRRLTVLNPPNLYVFTSSCGVTSSQYLNGSNELTGITAVPGKVFVSSAAGFTSLDQAGLGFNTAGAAYTPVSSARAAPSLLAAPPMNAVFGTDTGDVHRAAPATCTNPGDCWKDAYATPPHTTGVVSNTPVFDGTHVYASDDSGSVSSWVQATGAREWAQSLASIISAPVILQDPSGVVLVVQLDGTLKLVSSTGAAPLLKVSSFTAQPPVPALEPSGNSGVAYVPDGAGWLWAVNLPSPPMAASSAAWPRPGRDSCNSRNTGAPCP